MDSQSALEEFLIEDGGGKGGPHPQHPAFERAPRVRVRVRFPLRQLRPRSNLSQLQRGGSDAPAPAGFVLPPGAALHRGPKGSRSHSEAVCSPSSAPPCALTFVRAHARTHARSTSLRPVSNPDAPPVAFSRWAWPPCYPRPDQGLPEVLLPLTAWHLGQNKPGEGRLRREA